MSIMSEGRGVHRALQVLRALNIENGASIVRLSAMTKISRQALYRLLAALEKEGYVARRQADGRFVLTRLVRALSDGFRDEDRLNEVAPQELERLQRKVVWPTEMATCHNFSMHISYSTRRNSPFVIDYGSVGVTLPILRTALGLAYLANCAPRERAEILRYFRSKPSSLDAALAMNPAKASRVLTACRCHRYATRYRNVVAGDTYDDMIDTNATVAVPVLHRGVAVASIAVTYIASAMPSETAVSRYLDDLHRTAQVISQKLDKTSAARKR